MLTERSHSDAHISMHSGRGRARKDALAVLEAACRKHPSAPPAPARLLTAAALEQRAALLKSVAQHFYRLEEMLERGEDWPDKARQHTELWDALMDVELP